MALEGSGDAHRVVGQYLHSMAAGDLPGLTATLAPDFVAEDHSIAATVDRAGYTATVRAIVQAFPRIAQQVHGGAVGDGIVDVDITWTAHHAAPLDLRHLCLGVLQPTCRRVQAREEQARFHVRNGRIHALVVGGTVGGGVGGLLHQLLQPVVV